MSDTQAPAWWVDLQRAFGALIRTPLDSGHGRFRSPPNWTPSLRTGVVDDGPGAVARLALYQEQYWKRLFVGLQGTFPRFSRAIGYFALNRVAVAHLLANPPRSFDLADCAEGFFGEVRRVLAGMAPPGRGAHDPGPVAALLTALSAVDGPIGDVLRGVDAPWSLVVESLTVDEAERRAFRGNFEPPCEPPALSLDALYGARLRPVTSLSLVRLHWDMFAVQPQDDFGTRARLATPTHAVVWRGETAVNVARADALVARFIARARVETLGAAAAHLVSSCPPATRDEVQRRVPALIERAVRSGWLVATNDRDAQVLPLAQGPPLPAPFPSEFDP